jgi:predicted ATPase/DNA-binding CsgD family transcriptional regulator
MSFAQDSLTDRELDVLRLMADGQTNAEIAHTLVIALTTVKWYARQINQKLGVSSRTKAVAKARELGLFGQRAATQLGSADTILHNLPADRAAFIGRNRELHAISALLRTSRLVTLTGIGGSGKTRLALKAAWDNLSKYPDGVWAVFLGSLTDSTRVVRAIARALRVTEPSTGALLDTVERFLRDKRILLVLDNFEHVLDAAPTISELIASAPQLTVLVTSREVLNLYGEHEYQVPPLETPQANGTESVTQLSRIEAVQLFVQSARAALPQFQLTEANHTTIAQICAQLEGLPLSIELGAARLRVLSPAQLLERLTDRLKTLVGGPQDLPQRQRALRSTIEWSYNLLETDERALFDHMAVFRAGCTLDAIEAVHSPSPAHDNWELLESLIKKNLVVQSEGSDGQVRFGMLETIREYALERLHARLDFAAVYERCTDYYVRVVEEVEQYLRGGGHQYHWFEHFEAELSNISTTLEWAFDRGYVRSGIRLAGALTWFWWRRGYISDGRYWLRRSLDELSPGQADPLRAKLLLGAGVLEWAIHQRAASIDYLDAARDLYRQLGDEHQAAWALIFRAVADIGDAEAYQAALAMCDDGIAIFQRMGDKSGLAQALNIKGELTRVQDDYDLAKAAYESCLQLAREIGDQSREQMQYANLGFIAIHEGNYSHARAFFMDAILLAQKLNSKSELATGLAGIASALAVQEQGTQAAQLMAAATTINARFGVYYALGDQPAIDHYLSLIKSQLSPAEFEAAWTSGLAMSSEQAVQFAMSAADYS